MMPRDVSTRWNSTYDMLNFALDYRVAIDSISSNRDLNLRKYELQDKLQKLYVILYKHAS